MRTVYLKTFMCIFLLQNIVAQPNNNCSSPTNITQLNGTCNTYTTTGATYDTYVGGCMSGSNNVWFTFTAQGSTVTINATGASGSRPEIALINPVGGPCNIGTNLQVGCVSGAGNWSANTLISNSLTVGTTYYIMYTNATGVSGNFDLCVTNNPDVPVSGNDCSTKTHICANSPFSGNNNGFGTQELSAANRGCLAGNEHNSSWYSFTAATSGTIEMYITPQNGSDDYDFAVWGPNPSCTPTAAPVRCNFAAYPRSMGCGSNTNQTGMGPLGTATSVSACTNNSYTTPLNVTAGQTYIVLVDGFSPASQPFDLTWGGTASLSCIPLPIELMHFEIESSHIHQVILNWKTASENNNDFFTVERSIDGINFISIGEIKAVGNSNLQNSYRLIDSNPIIGLSYYRLKQTDLDGVSKYSAPLSNINNTHQSFDLKIYPNPSESGNQLYVELSSEKIENIEFRISDLSGKIFITDNITLNKLKKVSIERSFEKGIYLLSCTSANGETLTKKLIIK